MLRNPQRPRALMRAHTCTGEVDTQRWTRTSNCLRTVRGKLISTHKDTHNHADISWTRLKDTTPTLLREGRGRCRWDWIQTCLLTDRIELLISQQIVLWGIHGSTHGLSSSLRLRDSLCVDLLHIYTFVHQSVHGQVRWGNLGEGRLHWSSPNYFLWAEWARTWTRQSKQWIDQAGWGDAYRGKASPSLRWEGFNCSHTEWLFHWHSGNSTILSS